MSDPLSFEINPNLLVPDSERCAMFLRAASEEGRYELAEQLAALARRVWKVEQNRAEELAGPDALRTREHIDRVTERAEYAVAEATRMVPFIGRTRDELPQRTPGSHAPQLCAATLHGMSHDGECAQPIIWAAEWDTWVHVDPTLSIDHVPVVRAT